MLPTNSKIFITGATGFVGSYIVRKLISDGYTQLYCLRRNTSDLTLVSDLVSDINWVIGDILDLPLLEDVLKEIDVVIHAAAIVTFNTKNKEKIIETAMSGTANLVNLSLDYGIKKFIHISSIAAIGRRKKKEEIDEFLMFSHSEFDTSYGLSKFLAEQEVWRGHAEGLNVTILNPSMILGVGMWNKSSVQIFSRVFRGMKFYPEGKNGWVDVRDVANAVFLSLSEDFDGQRFIVSAENITYKGIFEKIASRLNVKPPTSKINYYLAGVFWRLEALRSFITGSIPVITKETIKSTSVQVDYKNQKSKEILGLNYRNIDETIDESCHHFLDTWPKGIKYAIFK